MALLDRLQNSNLGLKGASPARIESSFKSSTTHAYDPRPGTQGDEDYRVKSDLDLNGKTPHKIPSAYRSSATHVYDPDFSTDSATDPLLNLRGKELKAAQRDRRSNNVVTFDSVYAAPANQTSEKYREQGTSVHETGTVASPI